MHTLVLVDAKTRTLVLSSSLNALICEFIDIRREMLRSFNALLMTAREKAVQREHGSIVLVSDPESKCSRD